MTAKALKSKKKAKAKTENEKSAAQKIAQTFA